MKRYLIFGAVGPLVGGSLLFVTTWTSGYWTDTNLPRSENCSWCSPRRCNTPICSASFRR